MPPFQRPPQPVPAATEPERKLSSLEMLLLGLSKPPEAAGPPLRSGAVCPECGIGRLDYNGVLQLECAMCGFVSGEGAGCT
jgi:rubredoxin